MEIEDHREWRETEIKQNNLVDDCRAGVNIVSLLLRGTSLVRMLSLNYDTRSQVQRSEGKKRKTS
jgi:hypothetical protein